MAGISYIGKPISLVSHSDIRYRGILHGIDPVASTISLANVISMGTENRRPAEAYIPPSDVPYEFIIFRASEVKDIAVDHVAEKPPSTQRSVHDDPAVMSASAPPSAQSYPSQGLAGPAQPAQAPAGPGQSVYPYPSGPVGDIGAAPSPSDAKSNQLRPSAVDTATTGMENVQRAMGELRVSNGDGTNAPKEGTNGRRGRGPVIRAGDINIPTAEFDFAKANARFDKVALSNSAENSDDDATNPSDTENKSKPSKSSPAPTDRGAYNPKASFFDSLGANARPAEVPQPPRGGRGSRRGRGSSRREEERQRNVATFGEPGGGPGLMGPGAYVAGWGGSGRRGQGRGGRRGGPRPPQFVAQ